MFNSFFNSNLFVLALAGVTGSFCTSLHAAEVEATLPLKEAAWVALAYSKIPSNKVSFSNDMLTVKVQRSAGPIVHKLEKTSKIVEFSIRGKVSGTKNAESGPFDEDSVLRFGLVGIGGQTLRGAKKLFAADWVKKLFAMAPEGAGLDKIYFFNLTNRDYLIGKSRRHPKSDLIVETIVAKTNTEGDFSIRKNIEPPIETAAIWISIDGDDTQSEYQTVVSEIKLKMRK